MAPEANARVRAHYTCWLKSLPYRMIWRLRDLSLDYIREAERCDRVPETGEQISAVLDTVARDFFARALRHQSKK